MSPQGAARDDRSLFAWASACAALVFVVVASSAWLRIAAVPCPPAGCEGFVLADAVRLAHRVAAMGVTVLALVIAALAWKAPARAGRRIASVVLLVLVAALALVGRRSAGSAPPAVMLANLLGGLALLAFTAGLAAIARLPRGRASRLPSPWRPPSSPRRRRRAACCPPLRRRIPPRSPSCTARSPGRRSPRGRSPPCASGPRRARASSRPCWPARPCSPSRCRANRSRTGCTISSPPGRPARPSSPRSRPGPRRPGTAGSPGECRSSPERRPGYHGVPNAPIPCRHATRRTARPRAGHPGRAIPGQPAAVQRPDPGGDPAHRARHAPHLRDQGRDALQPGRPLRGLPRGPLRAGEALRHLPAGLREGDRDHGAGNLLRGGDPVHGHALRGLRAVAQGFAAAARLEGDRLRGDRPRPPLLAPAAGRHVEEAAPAHPRRRGVLAALRPRARDRLPAARRRLFRRLDARRPA